MPELDPKAKKKKRGILPDIPAGRPLSRAEAERSREDLIAAIAGLLPIGDKGNEYARLAVQRDRRTSYIWRATTEEETARMADSLLRLGQLYAAPAQLVRTLTLGRAAAGGGSVFARNMLLSVLFIIRTGEPGGLPF